MRTTITLATNTGPIEVEAYPTQSPNLFIHRPIGYDKGWRISHIPSGYCIFQNIDTLKRARAACTIWAEIEGWETLVPEKAREFFEINRETMYRGRDAALRV